jgi:hypothetical protein
MITIQLNKKLLKYTLLPYDDCGNVIKLFKDAYAVGMEPVTKPFLNKDFEENSDYEIPVAEYYAENSKTPIATVSIEGLYEYSDNGKADMLIANIHYCDYWQYDEFYYPITLKNCSVISERFENKLKFKVTDVNAIQSAIMKTLAKAETKMLKTLSKYYGYSIGKCEFKIREK